MRGEMIKLVGQIADDGLDGQGRIDTSSQILDLHTVQDYYWRKSESINEILHSNRLRETRRYGLIMMVASAGFMIITWIFGILGRSLIAEKQRRDFRFARKSLIFIPLSILLKSDKIVNYLKKTGLENTRKGSVK
jgi:hypothetical protein